MDIDFSTDPVLRLRRQNATYEQFQEAVAAAVEQHPGIAEAAETEDEALDVWRAARQAMRPTPDSSCSERASLDKAVVAASAPCDFGNDSRNRRNCKALTESVPSGRYPNPGISV